jgi:pimeloyl-ACP methyl ester carboxylesterase
MNAATGANKRTTVRTRSVTIRAARAGFRLLSPRAPGLAARWAERLFLTPRRHARPVWERQALTSAREDRVAHEGGWLPTWTWTPRASENLLDAPQVATVILVHGWEGRGSQLATFVDPLLERGLRVVAFDAPGHGDSTLPFGSVVEHARALLSIARAVGPVHAIIGHSVGGAAALFATRLGLEADRFALIAPPTSPVQFAAMFARMLGIDASVKDAMIGRLEARYAIPFDEIDARLDARRLDARLLVVHDTDDPVVSVEQGRTLAALAPRGTLIETSGLGHRAILRAPHVVESVTRFVAAGLPVSSFAATLDGELFMRDKRWSGVAARR